jgi:polyisoprenoid-binding protein YceI
VSRTWKWIVGVIVGVAVAIPAGTWLYINVIEGDAPPPLTLDSANSGPTTTTTAPVATSTSTTSPAPVGGTSPTTAPAATDSGVAGTWRPTTGSVLGYRVKEVLFGQSNEAVGRTSDITGSMTINGASVSAVDLTVNLKTIKSDNSQRDGQFHGRIMNTATFPNATFTLTQPLTLSAVPTDGAVVDAKATGDLTLRGTTKTVTFDLKAQRDGVRIKVNGTIPIVFADYRIPNPSAGPATTEDRGVVEFLVVFAKA